MRIKALKKLLWIVNVLLVLGMVFTAYSGFSTAEAHTGRPDGFRILGVHETGNAPPTLKAGTRKPWITYHFVNDLPISGMPPAPPPEETASTKAKAVVPALAQTYDLAWVADDRGDPLKSWAHLTRKGDKKIISLQGGQLLDTAWKLVDTRVENGIGLAVFVRKDTGEKVTLEQSAKEAARLHAVGGNTTAGIAMSHTIGESAKPRTFEQGPSREAVPVPGHPNTYNVPPEESRWMGRYADKVAEQVALESVRDPKTKAPIGIMVRSIQKDSVLESHGVQPHDILVAINGHSMSTKSQAMAYLKGEGKGLSRYDVTILRNGRKMTLTYNVKK